MTVKSEEAVCGMLINSPESLESILSLGLKSWHFTNDFCLRVFQAIMDADKNREPFDLMAIAQKIPSDELVGLVGLTESAPRFQDAKFYVEEIGRSFYCRKIEAVAQQVREIGMTEGLRLSEMKERLSVAISRLEDFDSPGSRKQDTAMEAADRYIQLVETQIERKMSGKTYGVPSGLENLDHLIHGFIPGALYIIGARPGVGKSELCGNLAINVAKQGFGALYVTFEMSSEEVAGRMISRMSQVSDSKLMNAECDNNELDCVGEAIRNFAKLPIFIADDCRPNWEGVKLFIRRSAKRDGVKVVFIDYIQQLHAEGFRPSDRVRELSHVSTDAKNLAKELGISIVCAAQLNRACLGWQRSIAARKT